MPGRKGARRYTQAEDEIIREGDRLGRSVEETAALLGRPPRSVYDRRTEVRKVGTLDERRAAAAAAREADPEAAAWPGPAIDCPDYSIDSGEDADLYRGVAFEDVALRPGAPARVVHPFNIAGQLGRGSTL